MPAARKTIHRLAIGFILLSALLLMGASGDNDPGVSASTAWVTP